MKNPDVLVRCEGTVFLFCPLTAKAQTWVKQNLQLEPWQWFGNAFVVEHRFAYAVAFGMNDAGLVFA